MATCALFMLLGAPILIWVIIANIQLQRRFEQKFPPLSDDEFVARCSPGTKPQIALKVRRTLADCLCVEYERIYPSSTLQDDLGAE